MAYQSVIYDSPEPGIARITLNRPESLNAITIPMLHELYAAADEAAADPGIAVLIYRGAGRSFCAGRDFKHSAELQQTEEGWFAWRRAFRGFGRQTWLHPKATIAQVHGHALGNGQSLAGMCDLTIASTDARFGYPEARYGAMSGQFHIWNHLIGPKRTKEYLFTGRSFTAEEAVVYGFVNRAVPPAELEETVLSLARDIVAIERKNPGYIRANKALINDQHPDLRWRTAINEEIVEANAFLTQYTMDYVRSQEAFYRTVAEQGMKAALSQLHAGFVSRPTDDR
jgi:enoyl-CoA hydratase/carnithine racemase